MSDRIKGYRRVYHCSSINTNLFFRRMELPVRRAMPRKLHRVRELILSGPISYRVILENCEFSICIFGNKTRELTSL